MLKLALGKGLNLQTNTAALEIRRELPTDQWMIRTSRGRIKATRVILATNGYTARLCRKFQGIIVPLRGHMTAQRQGLGMPRDGLSTTYSFIYGDGYDYMIQRPRGSSFEGDIMIGGGSTMLPEVGLHEFGTTVSRIRSIVSLLPRGISLLRHSFHCLAVERIWRI